MDISDTITANSEQVNADDVITPRVVTITGVVKGTPEQPVFIELAEFPGRTYRPCKSMRRVLASCWGTDASKWVGRNIRLYNDQSVKWGGAAVGGIRIDGLSHIDKRQSVSLTVSRGKRSPFVVEPLTEEATPDRIAEFTDLIAAATTVAELDAIAAEIKTAKLGAGGDTLRSAWSARKTVIESTVVDEDAALDNAREAESSGE